MSNTIGIIENLIVDMIGIGKLVSRLDRPTEVWGNRYSSIASHCQAVFTEMVSLTFQDYHNFLKTHPDVIALREKIANTLETTRLAAVSHREMYNKFVHLWSRDVPKSLQV